MSIAIESVETQDVLVLKVSGQINSITAITLGERLLEADEQGHYNIVLDIGRVDYISSAGLREIMSGCERAKVSGGDVRLANPLARVVDVLELTGLDNVFDIYPTRDEAVQSFA
jgi:anti-anti-sigma factor